MLRAFRTLIHFLRSIINLPRFPYILLVFMTFFLFLKSEDNYHFIDSTKYERRMLESDGSGYFEYLPQTIIYKTKNFEFINDLKSKHPESKIHEGLSNEISGKRTNKYFVGTSICIAPFYFVTHQIVQASGGNADGYSIPYELSVLFSGLAFWLLGMWSIIRLFRKFEFSNLTIAFSVIGLSLATNLYYYTVLHPDFAHVYAFGLIAFLLLQFKNYVDKNQGNQLIQIAALLGLITIIRPTDALIIIVLPFFFSSFSSFLDRLKFIFKNQSWMFLIGILVFGLIIAIQYLNIYQQTGQWRFNEYIFGAEGFEFLFNPKIGEVLFGFSKGFFIYTPFFILLIPGFIELYRWNKYLFVGIFIFFVIFVFINAYSWQFYGLGMRNFIGIYAILIAPVALLFEKAKKYFKVILLLFLITMTDVNLTYTYQLQKGIIHGLDMNKEKFLNTFLQTGKRYEQMVYLNEPHFEKQQFKKRESWKYHVLSQSWKSTESNEIDDNEFVGNPKSLLIIPELDKMNSKIVLEVSFDILIKKEESFPRVFLYGYQNGKQKELSVNHLKFQIPRLNRFYEVKAALTAEENYNQIDSLKVVVKNDKLGGLIKSVQCDVFVRK